MPEPDEKLEKPKRKAPKPVRSDLRDVTPSKRGAAFPHDLEHTPSTRADRRRGAREPAGARSNHVPHAVPLGENERRGGCDRIERRRRSRRRTPRA